MAIAAATETFKDLIGPLGISATISSTILVTALDNHLSSAPKTKQMEASGESFLSSSSSTVVVECSENPTI